MPSFFKTLWSEIKNLWKRVPPVSVAVASAVDAAVPFIEGIDTLLLPAAESAPINAILDKIKVGLAALKTSIAQVGVTPNLKTILDSINTNCAALLAAAQVKDPALVAKVEAAVTFITGEIAAISEELFPPTAPPPAA
jgi:hypothetical protein